MRRLLLIAVCTALCLGLWGCDGTLMSAQKEVDTFFETFSTVPPETGNASMLLYKQAMSALSQGKYSEAYELFTQLGDYKDAAEYVSRFTFLPDKLLQTVTTENGIPTFEYYHYDAQGTLVSSGDQYDPWHYSTVVSEDGTRMEIRSRTYQTIRHTYDSQNRLKAYHSYQQTLQSPRIVEEITVSYTYDGDLLISDSGEEISTTGTQIERYAFQGSYTYDEAGRLTRYDRVYTWGHYGEYTELFTYDESGRLARFESHQTEEIDFGSETQTCLREYSYNSEGQVSSILEQTSLTVTQLQMGEYVVTEDYTDSIRTDYVYANGRLLEETVSAGENDSVILRTTVYSYGDYLSYNPS